MLLTFHNPGEDYMVSSVLEFQTEGETALWSDAVYYFYPEIDQEKAKALPHSQRVAYISRHIRDKYRELLPVLEEKLPLYTQHWQAHQGQIAAALSEAFELNADELFNDLRCNISLNPVSPRYLREKYFEVFYLNSQRGALGIAIHEIIHFFWFHVWQQEFGSHPDTWERPHLPWILSEMAVEAIMSDERLSSINPYYPRENGGCVYPYFQNMVIDGVPILDTLAGMYKQPIRGFMREAYAYCQRHEAAIRRHIEEEEKTF